MSEIGVCRDELRERLILPHVCGGQNDNVVSSSEGIRIESYRLADYFRILLFLSLIAGRSIVVPFRKLFHR
jgi:hypothetical protein